MYKNLNWCLDKLYSSRIVRMSAWSSEPEPTDLYNTIYYKWMGVDAFFEIEGEVITYDGTVRDAAIPYDWYTAPAPGFELPVLMAALIAIPVIQKKRKK